MQHNVVLGNIILQLHNLQIIYLVQLWAYPLSICGCNIHPFHRLGKGKLQEEVTVTLDNIYVAKS